MRRGKCWEREREKERRGRGERWERGVNLGTIWAQFGNKLLTEVAARKRDFFSCNWSHVHSLPATAPADSAYILLLMNLICIYRYYKPHIPLVLFSINAFPKQRKQRENFFCGHSFILFDLNIFIRSKYFSRKKGSAWKCWAEKPS